MLTELFDPELTVADVQAATRDEAIAQLAAHVAAHAPDVDGSVLLRTLQEREQQASTALGDGVAIPHARIEGLDRMIAVLGRSKRGLDWALPDARPVHVIVLLAGPSNQAETYLKTLATVSRVLRDAHCRARLLAAASADELLRVLREEAPKSA